MNNMNNNMNNIRRPKRPSGWFQGAPLAKFLCFLTCASYLVLKNGLTELIALDLQDLVEHSEYYRLFIYHLAFGSTGETIMGMAVLAPLLKRFEREFGSKDLAAFLQKSLILATIFQCFFLSDTYLATGPYPTIGSTMYLYNKYTPRLYPKFVSVLGFDFSEKAITYFFAAQVILSQGFYSIIPFTSGYIAGFLATSPITPIGKWNPIPQFVYKLGQSIGMATGLADLSSTPAFVVNQGMNNRSMGLGGMNRRGTIARNSSGDTAQQQAPPQQAPPQQVFEAAPPTPEAIEQLTAMGFERDAVVRALSQADNNIEHAANRLLTG
uniref:UBA domain-containing protein n=1 Tax=Chaetoceros debilis TaxID=122233 RepID=A0A7S3V5S9_9STRA|mmetsp:Transcript_21290/g.31283  ORF Transcript_21290/g.31283 Transcript_21290/m.31283 type:complete len:324 (-) Transcript_21290:35-1006(-)